MEGKCFDVGMCHMSACRCRAAELKYGTLMSLQKQLLDAEEALKRRAGAAAAGRLLKEEVTEADIAEIISKWTGRYRGAGCACKALRLTAAVQRC